MSKNQLRTALLGLSEKGLSLLEAASASEYFSVEAVADKDPLLAEKVARQYDCQPFDDYRQLITQNQFDCLFVIAGMHSCEEYVRMALKKGINVLKLAPMARDFEEASELLKLAEEVKVKYCVTNELRFAESYHALREYLKKEPGQIFMLNAVCNISDETQPAWHNDWKLSGGGVILRNCYEIIDQIVMNFSAPELVYCLFTNQARDRQQRLYLTEDTAVITMKFGENLIGSLTASKATGPKCRFIKIHSKERVLTVNDNNFDIRDNTGKIIEKSDNSQDTLQRTAKMLENFALSIISPDNSRPCSTGVENLTNMAVIEAAYLSGRTSMPEEPARILKMAARNIAQASDL